MPLEDAHKDVLVIEKYVQKNKSQFTLEDASAQTGLPVIETKAAIDSLMGKYDSKLRVTENGDLIYDFGRTLVRRHKKHWSEYFWNFIGMLYKAFQVFYKMLTALFLIIYFVVFLVIVIGLAASSDDGKDGLGNLLGGMFRAFWSIFQWNTILGYNQRYYRRDRYGYSYQHYKEKPRVFKKKRNTTNHDPKDDKGFVASIYDFIFGPPRIELNPLANNQEVASFLRANKGMITTSEVQALAGWTREEAENFMTECLAYFDGDADISDNATLYGDFSQLTRSKNEKDNAPIIWYWDEYEPEHELTGNASSTNWKIIAMNAFNIIISSLVLSGTLFGPDVQLGLGMNIFLGYFPLAYSLSFFLIPLLRWFGIRKKQTQQHKENIRKRLMKVIFKTHSRKIPLSALTEAANDWRTTEEKLNPKIVDEVMHETIIDLGGEEINAGNGEIIYQFDLIGQELDDIDILRQNKKDDSNLGDVIFEA